MRYDGCLLTEVESRALIDDVNRWCRRTGTNYNKLVTAAGVNTTIRYFVLCRGRRMTLTVAARLRQAMQENNRGISKNDHKARIAALRPRPTLNADEIEARRVNREPCPRCAVRADIGCKHSVWSANVLRSI